MTLLTLIAALVLLSFPLSSLSFPDIFSLNARFPQLPADYTEPHLALVSPPPQARAAEPYSPAYPYTGALLDGLPGTGIGGVQVPAPGDAVHEYQDPPVGAYRGPCPGLNAAANHGFISRDGVTNFDELVAAQQNMYNVAYDLAVVAAVIGIAFDGDPITFKLSIGGDATAETSPIGGLLGNEGGLNTHNTFEADTSLTRNDYYLANGDNHSFNGTLFAMMTDAVGSTSSPDNPMYDLAGLSLYKYQRYKQSLATNPKFYFGPKQIILYGAASFVYELMSSSTNANAPDKATISSFFGAVPAGSTYAYQRERIPPGWHNRATPYTLLDVAGQLSQMYLAYPVLFGANDGVGNFDLVESAYGVFNGGTYTPGTPEDTACLLYQLITDDAPDSVSGSVSLPLEVLNFALSKLNPIFGPLGCSLREMK